MRTKERWGYRVMVRFPDGTKLRIRGVAPRDNNNKEAAKQAEREGIARALAEHEARKNAPAAAPAALESSEAPALAKEEPTVREMARIVLDLANLHNKETSTVRKEVLFRVHVEPYFGDRKLSEVTCAAIEDFQLAMSQKPRRAGAEAKLSPKTVNAATEVITNILGVAKRRGWIASVPEVNWLRAGAHRFDFLTFEEADQLIAAAEGELKTMILVALRTGLRLGELRGLRWEDVDLQAGRIRVAQSIVYVKRKGLPGRDIVTTPKSHKTREVPLSDEARAALRLHRHLRGPLVFCDANGKPVGHQHTQRDLWRACRRAELRELGWHVLRHTFASHLTMRGVPLKATQELLGHASITVTMRYAHLMPGITRDAVQLLDQPMQPAVQRAEPMAMSA
jgi:integrase